LGFIGLSLANRVTLGRVGKFFNRFTISHTAANKFVTVLFGLAGWEWHLLAFFLLCVTDREYFVQFLCYFSP